MRIFPYPIVAAAVVAVCFFVVSIASAQQNIVYPGASLRDPSVVIGPLAPTMANSLFPNTPSNNTVTVNSGTVAGHVFGGITATVRAESSNNRVFIRGGTIGSAATGGNVTGGWSLAGDVLSNAVTIDGGNVWNIIYGGWIRGDGDAATFGFNAKNNSVTIDGGPTIHNNIYGAYSQESRGELSGNTITILGGTIRQTGAADNNIITGAYSALAANNVFGNSVTIQGGTINNYNIFGARGQNASLVTNNTVTINDGIIYNDVSATSRAIYGGHISIGANGGVVSGNTVNITGGTISVAVYGGYATANVPASNYNHATGNFVNISGGTVTGDIYGGFSSYGRATHNIVTIEGGTVTGNLYGGNRAGAGLGDVFTGNTLNLKNFNAASTFGTIQNFEFINFGNTLTVNAAWLDITPTGSTRSGTTVYVGLNQEMTAQHTAIFGGEIVFDGNTGTLTKTGAGILAFADQQNIENKTLNLNTTGGRIELFGITDNGTGTLNIINTGPPGTRGGVFLVNDGLPANQFDVGAVNVTGTATNLVVLNLYRMNPNGAPADPRVVLKTNAFTMKGDSDWNTGSALLAGGGLIDATGGSIDMDGALLSPDEWRPPAGVERLHSTLTLKADTISLKNFAMLFSANPVGGKTQTTLDRGAANPIDISNNTLLDLETGGSKVVISNGTIIVTTIDGNFLEHGNYLIIRTDSGMENIAIDADLPGYFKLQMDDFVVDPNPGDLVRGSFTFKLGGDPDAAGDYQAGTTNLWLTTSLNSLTMEWTGILNNRWEDGNHFNSWQEGGNVHGFLSGDLVYITGKEPNTDIVLPGGNITVSGLYVGQDLKGGIGNEDVTFIGTGGITANADSAFGKYIDPATGVDYLDATGKLEKYGIGTLTFKNLGGNNFLDGIEIYAGTIAFTQANQLGDGGNGIKFLGNATLWALNSVTLANAIMIADPFTGSFGAADGVTFTYIGDLTGKEPSTLDKSGLGTLKLGTAAMALSGFLGAVTVSAGTLDVVGNYGNTTRFDVNNGATLTGTGTIGGPGTIKAGGTLMPGDRSQPNMGHLTVNDDLTFEKDSIFHVRIVPTAPGRPIPDADYVQVNGNVTIEEGAKLHVVIDYKGGAQSVNRTDVFPIIKTTGGHNVEQFFIESVIGLPRGIKIEQIREGWLKPNEFDLWFAFDPDKGLGALCDRHNRSEIGKTMDWFIEHEVAGLDELIDMLTDRDVFTDKQVCELLDQLHGDLAANAMFMALKEAWRHPFNHLSLGCPIHRQSRFHRHLWGEFTIRYDDVTFDGNAHDFTINRSGLAVGIDQRISFRSAVGLTLQCAEPRLRQETGRVKMGDLEMGLYAMTRVTNSVDMKVYLGYSHQQYDFLRTVAIPGLFEQLQGTTSGDALSMSVELLQPMRWRQGILITPIAAFDFEQVWMNGYRESAGMTSLVYDDATLARAMVRFGLGGDYIFADRLRLNLRLQYAAQLNDREYPAIGVRFANGPANQRMADIWGSQIGRDYVNVGLGTSVKLDARGNRLLYANYDAKWFDRANRHIGEAGIMQRW